MWEEQRTHTSTHTSSDLSCKKCPCQTTFKESKTFVAEITLWKKAEESPWVVLWNDHVHVQQQPTKDDKTLSTVRKNLEKKAEGCVLPL